jgi:hypothetical protein
MELELFFSNSKWEILSELSKGAKSPLELSIIFKTSIANISQQLRLMEAAGVIGKVKISNFEKGKPRTLYHINEEILYVVRLGKSLATKQVLKRDPFTSFILTVFSIIPKKDQFFLSKFFCDNSDILTESSMGLFKNQDKSIELFIITEKLEEARKKISNYDVTNNQGNQRKIVCWSHNNAEVQQGLKNNDPHFINLTKDSISLLDEKGTLEKFKETLKK